MAYVLILRHASCEYIYTKIVFIVKCQATRECRNKLKCLEDSFKILCKEDRLAVS